MSLVKLTKTLHANIDMDIKECISNYTIIKSNLAILQAKNKIHPKWIQEFDENIL